MKIVRLIVLSNYIVSSIYLTYKKEKMNVRTTWLIHHKAIDKTITRIYYT